MKVAVVPLSRRFLAVQVVALAAAVLSPWSFAQSPAGDPVEYRIQRILRDVPLIDGHNDLAWQIRERASNHIAALDLSRDLSRLTPPLHTDIPRLRRGLLGGQFWSAYVPTSIGGADAVRAVTEQIDVIQRFTERHGDALELARTAADVVRIHRDGRIASLIAIEGGHAIANSLAVLRQYYVMGARAMTLTHSDNTDWADSATGEAVHGGLSPFGRDVVAEMNRLGMIVDLSHVSAATMHDVLDTAQAPVMFSHSGARAVTAHARNVPDDVLQRLKGSDGVVMVPWMPAFVSEKVRVHEAAGRADPPPRAMIADVADHIDHIKDLIGVEHVGIGADLDGMTSTPAGLESVASYPALFRELIRRGYTDEELKAIAGGNVLRVLRSVEAAAGRLRKQQPALDTRLDELPAAERGQRAIHRQSAGTDDPRWPPAENESDCRSAPDCDHLRF